MATNASTMTEADATTLGIGTQPKIAIFVQERYQAARLAANDRNIHARECRELLDVRGGQPSSQRKQSLGDRRPSTALEPRQLDVIARGFQHPYRRDAHLGVVIGRKAIVELKPLDLGRRPACRADACGTICGSVRTRTWEVFSGGRFRRMFPAAA